jgi:hypothetical protein
MRTEPDLRTATWRRSSYSGGNSAECLEVSDDLPGVVPVRDSKNPAGAVVLLGSAAWSAFVAAAGRELL